MATFWRTLHHDKKNQRSPVRVRSARQYTPTKCQVSKRKVSKRPVSKRLKRQVYKTSDLQNVMFTKCQVYKTSGLQNVRLQKNIHIYIYIYLYLWLVEIRRFCCSHVCRQSDGCVLFSILGVSEVSRKYKKGGVIIPDDNIT
jgi:hypothetical protein